jgi:hypothetical protein
MLNLRPQIHISDPEVFLTGVPFLSHLSTPQSSKTNQPHRANSCLIPSQTPSLFLAGMILQDTIYFSSVSCTMTVIMLL